MEDMSQWVTFNLDCEVYGINVMAIQEVLRCTEIAPVPGSMNYILGIINLRGNVVTVVDGRMKLNLTYSDDYTNSRIIIIEVGNQVLGLMADSVSEVIELDTSTIEKTPSSNDEPDSAKYIYGVCQIDETLLILLDVDKLFIMEIDNSEDSASDTITF